MLCDDGDHDVTFTQERNNSKLYKNNNKLLESAERYMEPEIIIKRMVGAGACPGGGARGLPPPLEIEKQKKKGFHILGTPPPPLRIPGHAPGANVARVKISYTHWLPCSSVTDSKHGRTYRSNYLC